MKGTCSSIMARGTWIFCQAVLGSVEGLRESWPFPSYPKAEDLSRVFPENVFMAVARSEAEATTE